MFFGQNFGNFLGDCLEIAYFISKDPDSPDERTFTWTPLNASGVVYHLMVDGREWGIFTAATATLPAELGAREWIQVIETAEENWNEDVTPFAETPADTVELTWTASSDAVRYDFYRHTSVGAIANGTRIAQIQNDGSSSYTYLDQGDGDMGLADGATYWAVQAVDAADLTANSNEITFTINGPPAPPTNLAVTVI